MYKLTLGSENEIKYSNTAQHGLFSGTIETDRVVLVEDDGFPLDGNGAVAIEDASGVEYGLSWGKCHIPTYRATDESTISFLTAVWLEKFDWVVTTVPVFIYADIMVPQSAFDNDVDNFIEYLVDNGIIIIQNYENPKYELSSVSVSTAGAGYTDETVVVTVPGETGDTAGEVTVTIAEGACASAEITTAGSYEKKVASQVIDVPGGTTTGKIEVVMAEISE